MARFAVIGLCGGVFSGLLGIGGGAVMVPLLVTLGAFRQRAAHALSLGAVAIIGLAGFATYGTAGKVDYALAAGLTAGAIVGAPIGATLLTRAPEHTLKLAFGAFLLVVSVSLAITA